MADKEPKDSKLPPGVVADLKRIADNLEAMRKDIREMRTISKDIGIIATEMARTMAETASAVEPVVGPSNQPYLNP